MNRNLWWPLTFDFFAGTIRCFIMGFYSTSLIRRLFLLGRVGVKVVRIQHLSAKFSLVRVSFGRARWGESSSKLRRKWKTVNQLRPRLTATARHLPRATAPTAPTRHLVGHPPEGMVRTRTALAMEIATHPHGTATEGPREGTEAKGAEGLTDPPVPDVWYLLRDYPQVQLPRD